MLQSMGLERVRHDLMTEQQFIYLFGCSVAHRILVAEQGKLLEKERVSETSLLLKMRLQQPNKWEKLFANNTVDKGLMWY